MTRASKAVSCDLCDRWTHVRCSPGLSLATYNQCVKDGGDIAFVCDQCSLSSLPFAGNVSVDSDNSSTLPPPLPSSVSAPSSTAPLPVPQSLSSKGLHFVHANVRSLLPKIPEIKLFLSRTKTAVFAASETWLDSTVNDGEIQVPGFNVLRRDRNRNGGGVALFIRDGTASIHAPISPSPTLKRLGSNCCPQRQKVSLFAQYTAHPATAISCPSWRCRCPKLTLGRRFLSWEILT